MSLFFIHQTVFNGFEKTLLAIFWNLIFLYKWPSERKKNEKPKILEMDSL